MSRSSRAWLPLGAVLSVSSLASLAVAQDPFSAGPPQIVIVEPQSTPAPEFDVPPFPGGALDQNPKTFIPVPPGGPGLPEPTTPPHVPQPAPSIGPATGQFRFFYNQVVDPSGASVAQTTCEPSVAIHRDTVFYTGNFFGALSGDSGQTWTYINPSTRFPARDGGFCCDQRAITVPNIGSGVDQGMTLWVLEYRYSATTQMGSLRLARAKGRNGLRNNSWIYYDLVPTIFGQTNKFLDYSDISYSNGYFYGSCIIGNPPNSAAGLLLYRIPLQQIWDGVSIPISYYTTTQLGGFGSYRFAQGGTSTMYWAAHQNSSTLRVYEWTDAGTSASIAARTVTTWSGTPTPAPGPDGRDWTSFGYTVNTVLTGANTGSELSFWWSSGSTGASRPQTFVRVARFTANNARTLVGQFDLWNPSFAYHFPSASANSFGHVGGTFAYGGGTQNLSCAAFLLDQYNSFSNWASVQIRGGQRGPSSNRWGDYFVSAVNQQFPRTFVGSAYVLDSAGTSQPCYAWFGRDDYEPTWVNLDVQSSGVAGVSITIDETDRLNRKDGNTNFQRNFPPNQAYRLTAPASVVSGSTTYVFTNWALRVAPTGSFVEQAAGQRVLDVDTIGVSDDTAIARYVARRTLQVRSSNPTSGIAVTVSPADLNGNQNGTTPFDRQYADGSTVSLTAPALNGSNPFKQWILNGLNQPLGQRTISVLVNGTETATAVFYTHFAGSFTRFCSGCPGSGGQTPAHSGSGTPEIGNSISWNITNARGLTSGALYLGVSNTTYNGLRLPLNLAFIGMGATCLLCVSVDVSLPFATNAAGAGSVGFAIPNDVVLLQGHLYTQPAVLDLGAGTRVPVVHGNALDTLIGGNR
ncbi:MAG: hypothetical protein R3F56_16150 [Planctomycetota bacterium]